MRGGAVEKLTLLVLLVGIATAAFPAKSVKVDKLDQLLMHTHGKSDRSVAKQLFGLELVNA